MGSGGASYVCKYCDHLFDFGERLAHERNCSVGLKQQLAEANSQLGQIRHVLAGWTGELTDDTVPILGRDGWLERAYTQLTTRAEVEAKELRTEMASASRLAEQMTAERNFTQADLEVLEATLHLYRSALECYAAEAEWSDTDGSDAVYLDRSIIWRGHGKNGWDLAAETLKRKDP